jgi:hypothetical protein
VFQTVATTNASGVCFCQPAFDPATNQVYFYAQPGGVPTIVAANVQSGAVRSVIITPATIVGPLAWDPFSGKILSLVGFGPGPLQVVAIDPNTGALQTIVTTSIAQASADLALDVAGRRAFVFSSNSIGTQMLNTINLATGTVTTVSIASATTNFEAMPYDPFTGKLIVLTSGVAGPRIESMDPLTGARQSLVTLPPTLVTVPHGMTFEPFSRVAIIFDGASNRLAFANVVTAAVTTARRCRAACRSASSPWLPRAGTSRRWDRSRSRCWRSCSRRSRCGAAETRSGGNLARRAAYIWHPMRNRLPSLLVALGLLGVSLYPRLVHELPRVLRGDFAVGAVMGAFIGVELVGATMMIRRRSRCRAA